MSEETSATVASLAAKALRSPSSLSMTEIKTLAASALTQAPDRKVSFRDTKLAEAETLEMFLAQLTRVCRDRGIGIEGGTLYLMEFEDHMYTYDVDSDSNLLRK